MMKTLSHILIGVLVIMLVAGLCMAVSEGSAYCWANFLGLAMFGGSAYLLGLFRDPHTRGKSRSNLEKSRSNLG